MTRTEARERLMFLYSENERLHSEVDMHLAHGRKVEAVLALGELARLIDLDEVATLAMIAEGKEPPA